MQKDMKASGRPAARASPCTPDHRSWPAKDVLNAGVAVSPWNVTDSATGGAVDISVAVVAISCRSSSRSSDSGWRSRGCARLTRACLRREREWGGGGVLSWGCGSPPRRGRDAAGNGREGGRRSSGRRDRTPCEGCIVKGVPSREVRELSGPPSQRVLPSSLWRCDCPERGPQDAHACRESFGAKHWSGYGKRVEPASPSACQPLSRTRSCPISSPAAKP